MASDIETREVIMPSFTFASTANAVVQAGGLPVFADIDRLTLTLSPTDVDRKVTANTAAILAVDAFGIGADYEALSSIAYHGKRRIKLLRDSAPAFGTNARGQAQVPGIYSFHATKQFAVGEGGCVVSKNKELVEQVKLLRNFGLDTDGECVLNGFNGKMTEISAIIGLESFKTWEKRLLQRNLIVSYLSEQLSNIPGIEVIKAPANQDVSFCYLPVLTIQRPRTTIVGELASAGIHVRTYYRALHHDLAFMGPDQNLSVTDYVSKRIIAFPCYETMTIGEANYIGATMRRICR